MSEKVIVLNYCPVCNSTEEISTGSGYYRCKTCNSKWNHDGYSFNIVYDGTSEKNKNQTPENTEVQHD